MNALESPVLASLNDRQREAAQIINGPLMVLAGAGSGKTKMLTSRIAYLIQEHSTYPSQILAVTFTNKAAGEMKERVDRILGASGHASLGSPEIGTFHSICIRILRRELPYTPYTKPFVIYDDSDQLTLIKAVLGKLNIDEKSLNPKAVQSAINRAKCDAREPHELETASHNHFGRQLVRVYEQYQKDLFANHGLDFGEIICLTYRVLRDHPDVRERYQKRFKYIHVDEFQDTNRAQYLLLSMLASAKHGGHENICVVGDEDQSIYKWRGADIRNILDFEKDFPTAQLVKLEQNYRSTKKILTVANQLIRNNRGRKEKTLWTENKDGHSVIRAQLADERAEAEMVVSEIKRICESDQRTYGEFAIFYRTNAQSRQFEDILRREKIPYQVVGGLRFYDRKEIKDILAYFKVILNPTDSINLKRIVNVPARGIGKTTLEKLNDYYLGSQGEGLTYWEVLQRAAQETSVFSPSIAKKIGQFVDLIRRMTEQQPKLLLSELYHFILDETGYVRELRKEGTEEALSRIENLEEFDTLIQEFEEDHQKQVSKADLLSMFIEQTTLVSEADPFGQNENYASSVKLMTLHSSKGLEFPVVFMVGMEEGLFPSVKPWEETPDEDIEEERRLCYVGMTRAREILYLMSVVIRRIWGNVSYQEPSRFFSEVPDEYVEFRDFAIGNRSTEYRTGSSRLLSSNTSFSSSSYSKPSLGFATTNQGLPKSDWIGRRIQHPEYGQGTVISAEGSGSDQKVTIQFINRQQKKFLLKYIVGFIG